MCRQAFTCAFATGVLMVLTCIMIGQDITYCMPVVLCWRWKHHIAHLNAHIDGDGKIANAQGSHWSRSQRQFMTHDVRPHPLTTRVRPSDVPQFASADYGSRFALYSDRQQRLCMLGLHESLVVALARGESDLVTVVPITMVKGLRVAAIGEPLLSCLPSGWLPMMASSMFCSQRTIFYDLNATQLLRSPPAHRGCAGCRPD